MNRYIERDAENLAHTVSYLLQDVGINKEVTLYDFGGWLSVCTKSPNHGGLEQHSSQRGRGTTSCVEYLKGMAESLYMVLDNKNK